MLNASHSQTNRAALSAAFTSSAPPEHHRLVRDDADRPAVDAGQPGDEVLRPLGLDPEHLTVVDDRVHDLAHVVRPAGRGRDQVVELLGAAIDGIGRRTHAAGFSRLCCGKYDR